MRARCASIVSRSSAPPSGTPHDQAIPALVVAIAGKPARSRMRAEQASQALGRTKPGPPRPARRSAAALSVQGARSLFTTPSSALPACHNRLYCTDPVAETPCAPANPGARPCSPFDTRRRRPATRSLAQPAQITRSGARLCSAVEPSSGVCRVVRPVDVADSTRPSWA